MWVVCGDAEELSGAFPLEQHPREAHQSLVSGSAEASAAHLPHTLRPSLADPGTACAQGDCPLYRTQGPAQGNHLTLLGAAAPSQPRASAQTPSWSRS